MDVAIVEELSFSQQPEAVKQLPDGGSGNDRHVEKAVIGNRIGCLSKTCGVTDADGHDLLRERLAVGAHGDLEGFALEDVANKDGQERKSLGPHQTMPTVGEFDEFGPKTDVHTVEKIACEVLTFSIGIVALADVDETGAPLDDIVNGLLIVVGSNVPERGKVVADATGDDAEGKIVAEGLGGHDAVEGVVEHTVTSDEDYGLVTLRAKHTGEAFDTTCHV